jgi:hypothetical protein
MKETNKKVLTREEADKLTGEHIVIPEGYTEIQLHTNMRKKTKLTLNCYNLDKDG